MRSGPRIPATTVELALRLSDAGLLDRDNAEVFGIAVKTIRRWRRVYQREGRQRGEGRPSSSAQCPRCSGGQMPFDEEAYAHLLGWYLGDGSLARRQRGGYVLEIDIDNSYPGLIREIEQSMLRVKPNGAIHRRFRAGDTVIKIHWKHWPCLFPQHGPGKKHMRLITLELWQQAIVDRYPGPFLRGLFRSDGSRFMKRIRATTLSGEKQYEYICYFFSNKSLDILAICGGTLDQLGIAWRYTRPDNLAVSRRDAVAILDRLVGPKY